MNRREATQLVVDHAGDAAIVASLGHPAYDLFAAGDRPRNFYTWGSMGLASSVGLGLALARPDVRVIVLDGDGSLLMNLGSLATIGLLQPANFVLIVMDNEQFATTGGQPTPTSHGADLEAAARAMRVPLTLTVRHEAALTDALEQAAHTGADGDRRQSGRVGTDREAAPRLRRDEASLHVGDGAGRMKALVDFVVTATPPPAARAAAARAVLDTVGVTLAGASEPAARIVARVATPDTAGPCGVLGTRARGIASAAALANGTAAHALDFDDMCFVSLAHPQRAARRGGARRRRTGRRSRPRAPRRLHRRVRDRRPAGPHDESSPLRARLALHVDARHDWRGRRRIATAWPRCGRPPATPWPSPRLKRRVSRKTSARW
jgi:hypothetical protein